MLEVLGPHSARPRVAARASQPLLARRDRLRVVVFNVSETDVLDREGGAGRRLVRVLVRVVRQSFVVESPFKVSRRPSARRSARRQRCAAVASSSSRCAELLRFVPQCAAQHSVDRSFVFSAVLTERAGSPSEQQ